MAQNSYCIFYFTFYCFCFCFWFCFCSSAFSSLFRELVSYEEQTPLRAE